MAESSREEDKDDGCKATFFGRTDSGMHGEEKQGQKATMKRCML